MEENYTPIYRKLWFWLIIIVALGLIIYNQYINIGDEQATSSAQFTASAQPTTTASDSLAKGTIDPTSTASVELIEDTLYDEDYFSVVMPAGSMFSRFSEQNTWYIVNKNYLVMFGISNFGKSYDLDFVIGSEGNLRQTIEELEDGAGGSLKMDVGYKKVELNGKTAVKLTGEIVETNQGAVDIYYIESNSGLVLVMIAKVYYNDESATIEESNKIAQKLLDTLVIK